MFPEAFHRIYLETLHDQRRENYFYAGTMPEGAPWRKGWIS
jgi:hypothetical protein